ncbi:hypothetical protein D3C80_1268540 [compost metagenome]
MIVRESLHHAQAKPHGVALFTIPILLARRLQRAIKTAVINADRTHLDVMIARITHDLRRGVKPHGLRIEKRRTENIGMMAFQP